MTTSLVPMALELVQRPSPAFDPPRGNRAQDALVRLQHLYREQAHDYSQNLFLARSPLACVALMTAAAAALLLTDANLRPGFGWAVLVLVGVIAMVRNFIRGAARGLRRVPLQEAASDLRLLLFYTGAVWGSGAWLLMPGSPGPALVFTYAVAPALALVLILKDSKGALAFTLPVAIGVAGAAMLSAWPLAFWLASAIAAAALAIILLPALQHSGKNRIPALPLP